MKDGICSQCGNGLAYNTRAFAPIGAVFTTPFYNYNFEGVPRYYIGGSGSTESGILTPPGILPGSGKSVTNIVIDYIESKNYLCSGSHPSPVVCTIRKEVSYT